MADKQIIIDGVDVSGCPYYIHKDGSCSSHDCECVKCVHNVCFYKDYKAKEQECEELKEARKNSLCAWKSLEGTFCPRAQEQLDQYKQAIGKIKEVVSYCGGDSGSKVLCNRIGQILQICDEVINE